MSRYSVVYAICGLAGIIAGLSVAAGGLALAGRAILDTAPQRAEVFLVLGPLFGCFPVAGMVLAAKTSPALAQRLPAGLALWTVCAVSSCYWFGIRPLVR